jgi:hypothetical protein
MKFPRKSLPAPQGRLFNSPGFQPRVGIVAPAPSRLGLKPQAMEYSPLRGEVRP